MRREGISNTTIVLLCVAFLVIASSTQAAEKFKLKRVKVSDFGIYAGADVLLTTPNGTVIFARGKRVDGSSESLKRFRVDEKGKTSALMQLYKVPDGFVLRAKAVWLPEQNKGFLFVPTYDADGNLEFRFVEIDADGNPQSPETILHTFGPKGSDFVWNGSVAVAVGEDRIAVAMNANYFRDTKAYNGFQKAVIDYAEIGFDGSVITAPRSVKVDNNGLRREARLQDAAWNGERFLFAVTSVRYEEEISSGEIRSVSQSTSLFMHSITTGGEPASSQQLVDNVARGLGASVKNGYFLAPYGSSPAGKKKTWHLVYGTSQLTANPQTNLERVNVTFWTQKLNNLGLKKGGARKVKTPAWKSILKPTPGLRRVNSTSVSNALPLPDGRFLIAQTLTVREISIVNGTQKSKYGSEMRLLAINPKSGAVEVLAISPSKKKLFFSPSPILSRFDDGFAVLNGGLTVEKPVIENIEYLSRFAGDIAQ